MKVELTSVKHAAFASEETQCFEAVVLIDGKRAMTVRNDGNGGGNWNHDLIPGSEKRLQEYALTLPEYEFDGVKSKHNVETMIGDLLDDWLARREMKRTMANWVVYKIEGQPVMRKLKYKWSPATKEIISKYLAKHPKVVILNELPEDEALKLWKTN